MRFFTAGESHGRGIFAFVDGFPAGLKVDRDYINKVLRLRQGGYGRGRRQKIEVDEVDFLAGLRKDITTGAPILIAIWNKDFRDVEESFVPRPGHADLAGAFKYGVKDTRFISERASARETVGRVAVGALCELLLAKFGIELISFVIDIGGVKARVPQFSDYEYIRKLVESSELYTPDREAETKMKELIDIAMEKKDTLGGIFEIRAKGIPPGLGSHTQWDKRLDARLAYALMSIQAIKGVEIGAGFEAASKFGSDFHDEIIIEDGAIKRTSNRAGGTEGGITNGNELILRAVMKPISTLRKPLRSVNLKTMKEEPALVERADVCAVPAASVVGRAMVSIELVSAMIEKFGGDTLDEMLKNYKNYMQRCGQIESWME